MPISFGLVYGWHLAIDNAIIEALFMTVVFGLMGVGTYRRVKRKRKYYDDDNDDDDGKDA